MEIANNSNINIAEINNTQSQSRLRAYYFIIKIKY
jgi:prephenate dehydratase